MLGRLCRRSIPKCHVPITLQQRRLTTVVHDEASKLRNIAFVAHIGMSLVVRPELVLIIL